MTEADPQVIAHRGFAGVAPENSLAAFRAVGDGRHPADFIEFDVIPSADGTLMVFHDTRLGSRGKGGNRGVTDSEGILWETPTDTIAEARIRGSTETIPTLEALIDAVPPSVGLNLELRNPGTFDVRFGEALSNEDLSRQRRYWDPYVESVVETLEAADHDVLLSSFFEAAIAAARDVAPDYPIGVNVHDSPEDSLTVVDRYDCEAIHPRRNMIKGTPLFNTSYGSVSNPSFGDLDLLAEAADRSVDVNVWTVKTWYHAQQFATAGVDGLIADYPNLLHGWRQSSG